MFPYSELPNDIVGIILDFLIPSVNKVLNWIDPNNLLSNYEFYDNYKIYNSIQLDNIKQYPHIASLSFDLCEPGYHYVYKPIYDNYMSFKILYKKLNKIKKRNSEMYSYNITYYGIFVSHIENNKLDSIPLFRSFIYCYCKINCDYKYKMFMDRVINDCKYLLDNISYEFITNNKKLNKNLYNFIIMCSIFNHNSSHKFKYFSNIIDWDYLFNNFDNTLLYNKIISKKEGMTYCLLLNELCNNSKCISFLEKYPNLIKWDYLSSNPNAISLLEKNIDKINWRVLSSNPNAIELLEKNLDKINWDCLSRNPNAISLLEKNLDKINWDILSSNPNALPILLNNLDMVTWENMIRIHANNLDWNSLLTIIDKNINNINLMDLLSYNENIISVLEKYPNNIDWDILSSNPNAIPILEKNLDKINWHMLSGNPNAIELLEKNIDKINWLWLSGNPNAISLLESNLDRIEWNWLSSNPNGIYLLEKNKDKINWNILSRNPGIFVSDIKGKQKYIQFLLKNRKN